SLFPHSHFCAGRWKTWSNGSQLRLPKEHAGCFPGARSGRRDYCLMLQTGPMLLQLFRRAGQSLPDFRHGRGSMGTRSAFGDPRRPVGAMIVEVVTAIANAMGAIATRDGAHEGHGQEGKKQTAHG